MLLKLDMEKACDRMEWDFLKEVLSRIGFSEAWSNLVVECLKSPSFSVLVIGGLSGRFENQL